MIKVGWRRCWQVFRGENGFRYRGAGGLGWRVSDEVHLGDISSQHCLSRNWYRLSPGLDSAAQLLSHFHSLQRFMRPWP